MVPVAVSVVAWLPSLLGLGTLLPYRGDPLLRRVVTGFLGLGVAATAALAINFVAPISPAVATTIWFVGFAGLVRRWKWLSEGVTRGEVALALSALPWILFWFQVPEKNVDSGLYYEQSVLWATSRPVVLGLANLHGRLGFNSAWHLLTAALEVPWVAGHGEMVVGVLPMLLAAAGAGAGLGQVVAGQRRFQVLALAMLLPVVGQSVGGLGAASADQPASILAFFAVILWVGALESEPGHFADEARPAVLLSVFACLVKLSVAPILLLGVAAILVRRGDLEARWLAGSAALCAAMVLPWVGRSMLLSGCVVYPSEWSCVASLPWAVPRASVASELDWIRSWARTPEVDKALVLADWNWLEGWGARMTHRSDVQTFGLLMAVGLGLAVLVRGWGASLIIPLASAWAGLAYVFFTAPDPRFAFGFLHVAGLVPLAFGLSRLKWLRRTWTRWVVVALVVILAGRWARVGSHKRWETRWLAFPEVPSVPTVERVTGSGALLRQPSDGDQCWRSPPPCTPYPNEALEAVDGQYRIRR